MLKLMLRYTKEESVAEGTEIPPNCLVDSILKRGFGGVQIFFLPGWPKKDNIILMQSYGTFAVKPVVSELKLS